jgi:hypothetical protein
VRRVEIDKPDGGKRELGIPTVIDRVIQQAIAQILMPLFDPGFSADSYGFRPGRNAHQAVRRVQSVLKEGRRFTVDVDLSKFFDRVNHDLLMTHLGHKVRDKRLLGLIARYLRAGVIDNQLYLESREGVPQGGPLSPGHAAQVQATYPGTDEPELGCVDALPAFQGQPVPSGLDQLLWHRHRLSTLLRSGSLDSSPRANGLLATVAQAANQSQEPDEAGRSRAIGRRVWHYQ